ncbi:MAG TPA: spermidine/putrescine ABC transporter substrate-binding protein [Clostridiales bacterium]|nr:spermidine/putrescine ABC transporter substrate-binding protein [Clostridiales bacterium]
MKKLGCLLVLLLMLGLVTPLSATADDTVAVPLTGEYINVYNWGQYIADGSDGSIDLNAEFTRRTGIKVNYSTYESNEAMYTRLKNGGSSYDVIIPSDYMIGRLIAEDMLLPLDFNNIPNYQYVDEEFKNRSYDPENRYSVPYTWGTVGIIYNTKYVTKPVDSWSILWDQDYAGKILMFGNPRDAFGIAQLLLGIDVNTADKDQLQQAAEKLKEQRSVVQQYVMDQSFSQMEQEESWIVPYYAGDFLTMQANNDNLAFAFPKEGFNLFIDAMCIPASAQNKKAAEMYINFMCDPETSAMNMEFLGYSTPLSEAKQYMSAELVESEIAYPSAEILARGRTFETLPDETIRYMDELWSTTVRAGEGVSLVVYVLIAVGIGALAVFLFIRKKKRNNY